ncbi:MULTISPECIES: hypothetical protein [unclassified Methanosarcina]|uniref:hypothetical protein n=1 Tax=unclassified Methanosarcina TaxID=2644672 RepID=UPI0012E08364|nr:MULTISPECIES: hypothetical protein [unclassified Methanosarcina]
MPEVVRTDSVKITRVSSRTGFSTGSTPEIFKMTLSKIITPIKILIQTISSDILGKCPLQAKNKKGELNIVFNP